MSETKEDLNLDCVMRKFSDWLKVYQPTTVSKLVLFNLLTKYVDGDKEPLFGKFKQVTESEHYTLSIIFRDCLKYIGLNEEYKTWLNYA